MTKHFESTNTRILEFTQRLSSGDPRPLYVNPHYVRSLHVIQDDGTGITLEGMNGVLHVNESIHYVAAVLEGRDPSAIPPRRRPRKG